jgi:hypothetical protein
MRLQIFYKVIKEDYFEIATDKTLDELGMSWKEAGGVEYCGFWIPYENIVHVINIDGEPIK